ncbi:MAG: malate synthase [Sulfolobales archaeon]
MSAQRSRGLVINEDVLKRYSDLFGERVINGRRVSVEGLIEELAREFMPEIDAVIRARREWLDTKAPVSVKGSFPRWDDVFVDADGNRRSFREILQGLVDNILDRDSELRWGLNRNVPVPRDVDALANPGLEITGPWYPLSRAFNQVNADVASAMEDEEDASPAWYIPYNSGLDVAPVWEARRNTKLVLSQTAPQPYYEKGKEYRFSKPREKWPSIFHRIPGLHLIDHDITLDGKPIPAIITSIVIYVLNNYESLKKAGSGIYFYVPKVQTPQEALVIEKILRRVEEKLGLRIGEIKIAMLYEEANAGRYLPVIYWIWRERLIKVNNGRWDYLGSLIEMWKDEKVFPDPQDITMTAPIMMAYQKYNALLTLMAGYSKEGLRAAPVGGMAAVMLYPETDPYGRNRYNARALRGIFLDKLRERLIGLVFIPDEEIPEGRRITLDEILEGKVRGRLFDLFRQSWVATKEESYVYYGNKPLRADLRELQALIDAEVKYIEVDGKKLPAPDSGLTESERKLFQRLGLIDERGRITPWVITRDMIDTPEKLLTNPKLWGGKDLWRALYEPPEGSITPEHIQHAFYMAANYGFQLLNGNLAAAIDDYELNQRFMNDLATYRIFVSWLWTVLRHRAKVTRKGYLLAPELTRDGVIPAKKTVEIMEGEEFTEDHFRKLWELHMEWTEMFYREYDERIAKRILVRAGRSPDDRGALEKVREIVSIAYSTGPFRILTLEEASKKIAEILGINVKEVAQELAQGAPRFDRKFAPVIMEILRRKLTSPRYIQHSGRVLFELAPLNDEERIKAMEAIFSPSREHVVRMVESGELDRKYLELHDYIYDYR